MAGKVTELHRTGDAVALMLMTEEGELHAIFIDYLLVTGHTEDALMREIYDNTFLKKTATNSGGETGAVHWSCFRWAIFQCEMS